MTEIDPELKAGYRLMPRFVIGSRNVKLFRRLVGPMVKLTGKPDLGGLAVGEVPVPGTDRTMVTVRRATSTESAPVLFWIHGGGYVMGSNETEHRWGARFCRDIDCAFVAPGYRLAPEHPFPAGLDDLRAAISWVLDHGAAHGFDPTRIVVAGESAGGGLAAALVQRLHDEGVTLRGQVLVYPMLDDRTAVRTDVELKEHLAWSNASNHFGWTSYLGTEPGGDTTADYAVPARRDDLTGLPPAWIGVGDLDLFHDENLEYARRLEEVGVPVTLETAEGAPHGFPFMAEEAAISQRFLTSAVDFAARTFAD